MLKPNIQQIAKLIKEGFNPQLIAFEFRIPIEKINSIKRELEHPKKVKKPIKDDKSERIKRRISSYQKLQMMRNKYNRLYFDVSQNEEDSCKKISLEERKKVDSMIDNIEQMINSMRELSYKQKIDKVFEISNKIKELKKNQLSIEQCEKMILLLQSTELKDIINKKTEKLQYALDNRRTDMKRKLVQAIDVLQSETSDLEELKKLKQKINSIHFKRYEPFLEAVKSKINIRIRKISDGFNIEKFKSDIPESILEIVRDLSKGTLDIESANVIINEEAKRRVQSRVQNKFSLTEEQERNQMLFQIRTALEERTEQYNITNPETTIYQLHDLCGSSLNLSVSSVVENLINSKEFEKAKKVYAKFNTESQTQEYSDSMVAIRKKIRNAEIGDMVLRGIKENGNAMQDANYFELIEKGLKQGYVNMRTIYLGKSQSGLINITLADVWPNKEKEKYQAQL